MADNWPHPILGGAPYSLDAAPLVHPTVRTESFNSAPVEPATGPGRYAAVQSIGSFEEGPTLTGSIEQSANGSDWTPVEGASFPVVTEGNQIASVVFVLTEQFVRYAGVIGGVGASFTISVILVGVSSHD